jgi:mRNA interferase MazF
MRHGDVWIGHLDKVRPLVILTRSAAIPSLRRVSIAPITSRIRGVSTEVPVGVVAGLDHESVISCDNIQTVLRSDLSHRIGALGADQLWQLYAAIRIAFDMP